MASTSHSLEYIRNRIIESRSSISPSVVAMTRGRGLGAGKEGAGGGCAAPCAAVTVGGPVEAGAGFWPLMPTGRAITLAAATAQRLSHASVRLTPLSPCVPRACALKAPRLGIVISG